MRLLILFSPSVVTANVLKCIFFGVCCAADEKRCDNKKKTGCSLRDSRQPEWSLASHNKCAQKEGMKNFYLIFAFFGERHLGGGRANIYLYGKGKIFELRLLARSS